jgi:hypothetical protein
MWYLSWARCLTDQLKRIRLDGCGTWQIAKILLKCGLLVNLENFEQHAIPCWRLAGDDTNGAGMIAKSKPRVLVFSQRNISHALFHCPHYEFEDVICKIDSAELLVPHADPSSLRYSLAKRAAYRLPVTLDPGIEKFNGKDHYELFFAICGIPSDLLAVDAAIDWRQSCTTSVCLIDEFWIRQIDEYRQFLRILAKFDIVMLYYSQSVKPVGERIHRKCSYLAPGVDALLFNPYPEQPKRAIDLYSIGRRSEITHQKLLQLASNARFFYLHDSIRGSQAINPAQHRTLFANIAKRSRYFIVNPGLIDDPKTRGNQSEIGNRYFEGAASGTIMVGERPQNEEFERLFDWPDALIDMPYDSSEIDLIIQELDRQPERQERIRQNNVAHALLRHDWAYRWDAILKIAGLAPMPQLLERKELLQGLGEAVLEGNMARTSA